MTTLIQFLKQELLTGQCCLCHHTAPIGLSLCEKCLSQLPLNLVACSRCANPLHSHQSLNSAAIKEMEYMLESSHNDSKSWRQMADSQLCGKCLQHSYQFDQVFSPFLYHGPMINLLHRFKYQQKLFLVRTLSQLFLSHVSTQESFAKVIPDVLIPIPLYPSRIRQRGFNQAIELTKQIARQTTFNIDYECLKRIKATSNQRGLNAKQREKNIKNAFAIKDTIPYNHIVLIDDVMTTGNTVNEAAKVLKKAGAKRVDVWTIARA